ncbi:hypothetical protein RB213_007213, partial [Colletotrichum asianum]
AQAQAPQQPATTTKISQWEIRHEIVLCTIPKSRVRWSWAKQASTHGWPRVGGGGYLPKLPSGFFPAHDRAPRQSECIVPICTATEIKGQQENTPKSARLCYDPRLLSPGPSGNPWTGKQQVGWLGP